MRSIRVTAGLLRTQDHPYRFICNLRKGASDSLVELEMVQHPADAQRGERVPDGLPFYAIKAHMRELNVRNVVSVSDAARPSRHRSVWQLSAVCSEQHAAGMHGRFHLGSCAQAHLASSATAVDASAKACLPCMPSVSSQQMD